jgi:hypothetical protein
VGNDGETLVADSSTSTGLRYQVPVNVNPVLNSAMQIWQRGTTRVGAGGGIYAADRWNLYAGSQVTVTRQATNDTTNLAFIQYCSRVQRNNASTDPTGIPYSQSFETVNSIPYAGKTVTFSFYARKGANYSAPSSILYSQLLSGTGTDQNVETGFTGQVGVVDTTVTLTSTWQRFTFTGSVGATATQLATRFTFVPTGTAGANDYFEITGVQVEVGSVATPFKTYAGTIQGELAACQRYYFRSAYDSAFANYAAGVAVSTTGAMIYLQMPVTMRIAPSAVEYSGLRTTDGVTDFGAISTLTINTYTNNRNIAGFDVTDSGFTAYRPMYLAANNGATAYVAVTAEL